MIITKERDDKAFAKGGPGRSEFPKLLLEEEGVRQSEDEKQVEKTLSTREIITFLLFCIFFIVVVYMQVSVGDSYAMNNSLMIGINQNEQDFKDINVEDSFWIWIGEFIDDLYNQYYYDDYQIPSDKRRSIPNLNVLASPIRITQRRMKLVSNDDVYTQAYIKDGWASLGFDYDGDYDSDQETTDSFGGPN